MNRRLFFKVLGVVAATLHLPKVSDGWDEFIKTREHHVGLMMANPWDLKVVTSPPISDAQYEEYRKWVHTKDYPVVITYDNWVIRGGEQVMARRKTKKYIQVIRLKP